MNFDGSKPFTSAAMRVGNVEASNRVIGATPLLPATRALQDSSTPMPTGDTSPRPVTTTRRLLMRFTSTRDVTPGTARPPGPVPARLRGGPGPAARERSAYFLWVVT